jgi:FkbM family methyltransferase
LVEANPQLVPDLVRVRPESIVLNTAVSNQNLDKVRFYVSNQSEISSLSRDRVQNWREGAVGEREVIEVPCLRYDDLIEQHLHGKAPLFLSIDIEGHDLEVLMDANLEKYGPLLLQAEAPDHRPEILNEIARHMKSKGYSILAKTLINIIFIKDDPSSWI